MPCWTAAWHANVACKRACKRDRSNWPALTIASDPSSAYAFAYNGDGQVTSVDNSLTPNVPHVVLTSGYDLAGDRTSPPRPNGNCQPSPRRRTRDGAGWLLILLGCAEVLLHGELRLDPGVQLIPIDGRQTTQVRPQASGVANVDVMDLG